MKVADQTPIEILHGKSNFEGIEGRSGVPCAGGEHVELDEVFVGGELVLFPSVEVSSGVSFGVCRQKGGVHLFPKRFPVSEPFRRFLDDIVKCGLGEAICFPGLHKGQSDKDSVKVTGKRSFVCEDVDSDLSFPGVVFRFGAIVVIRFVDNALGGAGDDGVGWREKRSFPVVDVVLKCLFLICHSD